MDRLQIAAILTRLVDSLRRHGSWCGETHVQKACYFLQELLGVPLSFEFVLYRHGPFSFDLRNQLTALRADRLLELELQAPPFGPRLVSTAFAARLQQLWPKTLKGYENKLEFVADCLDSKNVNELERLATAFYVRQSMGSPAPDERRTRELVRLKPHIRLEDARSAVAEVEEIIVKAKALS